MVELGLLIFLIWLSLSFNLWIVYKTVRKGNKDQQEIKTRLHWVKWRQLKE